MLFHKQAQEKSENVNILKPVYDRGFSLVDCPPSAWTKQNLLTMCQNTQIASAGFEKAKAWLHVFCPCNILVGKPRSLSQICNKIKEMASFPAFLLSEKINLSGPFP